MTKKLLLFLLVLFCTATLAADLPRVAVYVTGDIPDNEKSAFGTRMLSALINSGRYMGIERSESFLAEVEKEHVKQRSGAIDDNQISELGRQFGVKYVCIAAITPAFGSFQVSARIVDVETAVVVQIGEVFSPLRGADDLTQASDEVVRVMFSGQAATPKHAPAPVSVQERGSQQKATGWNYDRYLTLRWVPVTTPAYSFSPYSFNLETGAVNENGTFFGVDIGGRSRYFGISFNVGSIYEVLHELKFVYGASGGAWHSEDAKNNYYFGPFIGLRWAPIELSSRLLIGNGISYQQRLGLYFEGKSRYREEPWKRDDYVAIRWLPVVPPAYSFGPASFNLEKGWVWRNGMFLGVDGGFGVVGAFHRDIEGWIGEHRKEYVMGGIGLSVGSVYELKPGLKFVYGVSVGSWFRDEDVYVYDYDDRGWDWDWQDNSSQHNNYYLGPFARLRWNHLELYNRLLIGNGVCYQLGIGLYFEGSRRHRQ